MTTRLSKMSPILNQIDSTQFKQVSTSGSSSPDSSSCPRYQFKVKSELCKKFIEKGHCPYGVKCKFAHGSHELRQNNNYNCKYKTKACMTFFNNSQCKYGQRCNFLHQREKSTTLSNDLLAMLTEYPDITQQLFKKGSNCSSILAKNNLQ